MVENNNSKQPSAVVTKTNNPPKKTPNDIHPSYLSHDEDSKSIAGDPEQLCCLVQEKTIETINWYIKKKWWPKFFSRVLRFFAIVFAIVGGLAPIIGAFFVEHKLGQIDSSWGYVALALSGSFILMDKLFGFSTTWMRFVTTQIQLQQALAEFQMDWAMLKDTDEKQVPETPSNPNDVDIRTARLDRLKKFQMEVWEIIEKETQAWITEFRSSLALLEKRAQAGQKKVVAPIKN